MSEFSYWEIWEEATMYKLIDEGYSHEEAIEILNKLEETREQSPILFYDMCKRLGC